MSSLSRTNPRCPTPPWFNSKNRRRSPNRFQLQITFSLIYLEVCLEIPEGKKQRKSKKIWLKNILSSQHSYLRNTPLLRPNNLITNHKQWLPGTQLYIFMTIDSNEWLGKCTEVNNSLECQKVLEMWQYWQMKFGAKWLKKNTKAFSNKKVAKIFLGMRTITTFWTLWLSAPKSETTTENWTALQKSRLLIPLWSNHTS